MGEFRMPSLGADMDVGTIVEWLVGPGDAIKRGQIVAVVDTAKAAIEIEAFENGVIEELLIGTGVQVPVGTPLAIIGASVPGAVAERGTAWSGDGDRPPTAAAAGHRVGASGDRHDQHAAVDAPGARVGHTARAAPGPPARR